MDPSFCKRIKVVVGAFGRFSFKRQLSAHIHNVCVELSAHVSLDFSG